MPNQFPVIEPPGTARIALIGSAPGRDDAWHGGPFLGTVGLFLNDALGTVGIARNQCFIGNVCQIWSGDGGYGFDRLDWMGEEVQAGVKQLREDLEKFQPTIVLCLGNEALHLFKTGNEAPSKRAGAFDWPDKIGDWRGSLFWSRCMVQLHDSTPGDHTMPGVKCMATHHPSAVLRDYGLQGYVKLDLERLREESGTRGLMLPRREIVIRTELTAVLEVLACYRQNQQLVAVDIEGYPGNVTSIAFASCPEVADVVPLAHADGTSIWSEEDEVVIWGAVKELIEDPRVPKLAQNGQYDFFSLAWTYGILVRNWAHDTMLSQWEIYAELNKSLACQASLWTKEQFYKPDREDGELKFESDEQFWTYNGRDAAVTLECHLRQMERMRMEQRRHYQFNCELLPAVLYKMLRGVRWDKKLAKEEQAKALERAWVLQYRIDNEAAVQDAGKRNDWIVMLDAVSEREEESFARIALQCLGGKNPRVKVERIEERWQPMRWGGKKWVKAGKLVTSIPAQDECFAKAKAPANPEPDQAWWKPMPRSVSKLEPFVPKSLAECEEHILESNKTEWKRAKKLWKELNREDQMGSGTVAGDREALLGELATVLGMSVNVGSTSAGGDAQKFLYGLCGLARIFKDERTGRYSRETERDWKQRVAGVKVAATAGKRIATDQQALDQLYAKTQDVRVLWVLQLRRLRKVARDLEPELDDDGRLRASVSLVKDTGRMSESKSPAGTGMNRQSLNKDLRWICTADEGCVMIQKDFEGADSWTVAAECKALGDGAMLADLEARLKPAQALSVLYLQGAGVNEMSREAIRIAFKQEKPSWLYAAAKSVCHGSAYLMGPNTMIETILKFSMADLPLELGDVKPIVLEKIQAEKLQKLFFLRYPGVVRWHLKEGFSMLAKGYVEMSTGHRRLIFGRKAEWKQGKRTSCHETLKAILATKPQYYTTLSAKLAEWRLWHDPANRRGDGSLRAEPLILVHDSMLVQARKDDADFAREKMNFWMNNPLEIAGMMVTIPASGTMGGDWGMDGAEEI